MFVETNTNITNYKFYDLLLHTIPTHPIFYS